MASDIDDHGDKRAETMLREIAEGSGKLSRPGRRALTGVLDRAEAARRSLQDYTASAKVDLAGAINPTFIAGFPRTGTSYLLEVMAADKQAKFLLNWEVDSLVPPSFGQARFTDPRAARRDAEIARFSARFPELTKVHFEQANDPTECDALFLQCHRSPTLALKLGDIQYLEYITDTDNSKAYLYHRLALSSLSEPGQDRWLLKMPSHSLYLNNLLQVYPNAKVIWIHRNPLDVLRSFRRLIAALQLIHLKEPDQEFIDYVSIWQMRVHISRLLKLARSERAACLAHVLFDDLVGNPAAIRGKLIRWQNCPTGNNTLTSHSTSFLKALDTGINTLIEQHGPHIDPIVQTMRDYQSWIHEQYNGCLEREIYDS